MEYKNTDINGLGFLIWFVVIVLIIVVLSGCGMPQETPIPTPMPVGEIVEYDYSGYNIDAEMAKQYRAAVREVTANFTWESITNPTLDCSARRLRYTPGLRTVECIFIRCEEYPVLSCLGW